MSEENPIVEATCAKATTKIKKKRDIFRFAGPTDMAINLDHVYKMVQEGKRITFQSSTADFVDFEDEESAKRAYEQILNVWSADVGE